MMSTPFWQLEARLAQYADHFGPGQRLIVGADEDRGDGPLHIDGLGSGEEACQFVQRLAIAEAMARQRVERADLRARPRHARDPRSQ